ncbi:MAG TPA: TMEM175 family protein [Acidimicrobiales bacterium]|nr:TMEM175 family protein [Acidimicrobiales bacterium]
MSEEAHKHGSGPGRMIGFSDGVMAVIITIMAFDLRPPSGVSAAALEHRLPMLLVYLLSFTYIGIYWNNHHHLMRLTHRIDGRVMWANLHLLFWLSLMPVLTEWVGTDYHHSVPAAIYGIAALGAGFAYFLLVRAIIACEGADSPVAAAVGSDLKGLVSELIYAAGVALAFVDPYLAYGFYAAVALMWFVPDRRMTRHHAHEHREPAD